LSIIREATEKDVPCLMKIASACFPHSIYWTLENESAYRRWKFAINSRTSEVWLCEGSSGISGFSLNILDEVAWNSSSKFFEVSGFRKLLLTIKHPKRGYLFVKKNFSGKQNFFFSNLNPNPSSGSRLFVDLFAVVPGGRRKGVASVLLKKNSERASVLGRDSVIYNVDRDNIPMQKLMNKHGLVVISENQKQFSFLGVVK